MNIYVFRRSDGTEWADFRVPPGAKTVRTFSIDSEKKIQRVIKRETGRVKALAERALTEMPVCPAKPSRLDRVRRWVSEKFNG
jgi:hypothetical protein